MKYSIIKYPDGGQYVKVEEFSDYLRFEINSYSDLWTLRQIKDVCDHNKIEVDLFIPCIFDAQADRRFNSNESSGLKLVCEFINSMKWNSVSVFHPHNPEVIEVMFDNVRIIDNSEFITKVLYQLDGGESGLNTKVTENLILMSTDAGGFKPMMKLADKLNWVGETFSASKSRKYENGKTKLVQQLDKEDFQGKDILIVDDLCVNGGTFIGLSKLLREKNCGKLYLAVSHITVQYPNPELFKSFDHIFTTDSKGLDYMVEAKGHDSMFGFNPENLTVISCI